jgi:transcriptional regulator with XRE-family HTH domain
MEAHTLRQLALAARGRRVELGLSQAEVAARARVSRQWVSEFEAGKATAELGLALRLLDAVGLRVELVPAESAARAAGGDDDAIDLDALLEEYRGR